MSAYRYVVFPRARQPAASEVRELQNFAAALAGRFAWGRGRDDGRLTIAFDRDSFDHVTKIDPGFEALVARWQLRGCELLDHLGFVKDPSALRPAREPGRLGPGALPPLHSEAPLPAKELAAQEAIARSRLSAQRTLEHYAVIQRVAAAVPYLLIGIAALLLIATGLYARDRLLNSDRERRQETIQRVLDDPLQQSLTEADKSSK